MYKYKKVRVLITGGNGQLGQEWAEFCNKKNLDYVSLSSKELDITNKDTLKAKIDEIAPNVIINCAAYTKVDLAEENVEIAFAVNQIGTKNIAEYCAENAIKLVHYSTDYIFSGNSEDRIKYPQGYAENAPTNPINIYGKSKLAGEISIKESGCKFLIFRIAWVCGKFGNNFVKTMLNLAKMRNELNVVNDQYGSPTFAENIVYNSWKMIEADKTGVYNINSSELCTWYDFAVEIFKQTGLHIKVNSVSSDEFISKAKRPAYSKLNTNKIAKFEPIKIENWKVGLTKLLNELSDT